MINRLFFFLSSLVLLAALLGCSKASNLRGGVLEPPQPAANFTLNDQDGKLFTLDSQRGYVVLLYFGYTSCPDLCPLSLANMTAARRQLGDSARDVQLVFISVDPDRDTQAVLERYVSGFDPSLIGLRGAEIELKAVMAAYGVKATKTKLPNSALGYTVDHTTFIYAIDRAGRLRETFPFGVKVEDIANDLKILVSEGAS